MANAEQLAILKQSVEAWNKWRAENFDARIDPYIDLSGADLFRANLRNANLFGANLQQAFLREADLRDANLGFARLSTAQLDGAKLNEANLGYAYLQDTSLTQADLSGARLTSADLSRSILSGANLTGAQLGEAILRYAILNGAKLIDADLSDASLAGASISLTEFGDGADLSGVNLSRANLFAVQVIGANLSGANLQEVNLRDACLNVSRLSDVDLRGAKLGSTIFGNVDLSTAKGLGEIIHEYLSTVGTNTISFFKGKVPEKFLRGCGLSDADIEYAKLYDPGLSNQEIDEILYNVHDLRAQQPLQISPLFISYSHDDGRFVDKLESSLNVKGIRFWRDIHDMKSGRIEKQIDRAIRQNPTVLLVLSEHSLNSDWIEHEVRTARQLEKDLGRDVLCPVALDNSWKDSRWPKRVIEQIMEYNILDFSAWEDDVKFESMFRKLIDGLDLFYKG